LRNLFGGIIALILLGLYLFLVGQAVMIVLSGRPASAFLPSMASALATIGGLVSAFVIAELALSVPGKAPGQRFLNANSSARSKSTVTSVAALYVTAWLAAGLIAFIVGALLHTEALKPLTDLGNAWLGIAIAAGYAYLGIDPRQHGNA
jgi:hypothetical protein